MSFVLDTNFIITLKEIGQLHSLLCLKRIVVPKIIKEEARDVDFDNLLDEQANKFSIVEISHNEKSDFIREIAQKSRATDVKFYLELEDQAESIALPNGWKSVTDLFLLNDRIRILKNVFTNNPIACIQVRKSEETKIVEHPDVHICALAFRHRKYYILSMDACIWIALNAIDPKFKDQIISIFRYLQIIFKDQPKKFIEILAKVIEKRFSFAKDLIGSTASFICYDHLEKSIDDVLARYVSDAMTKVYLSWKDTKDSILELFRLRGKIRDVVKKYTRVNETLMFCESGFIKELKEIGQALKAIDRSLD